MTGKKKLGRAGAASAVESPPSAPGDPRMVWLARAMVAVAAIATFARGVTFPLIRTWDDGRFLLDNPDTTTVSAESFRSIATEVHFQAYHPLHLLSYWIDAPWAGTDGAVIHATNIVLWVIALLVVLELLRELGLSLGAAVIATLFFGLHTVQVEAVTWATGRKEILAIGLACGAWLLHLRSERWTDRAAWGSRALYVVAALAKTTVLPLPAVIFAGDVILRRRPWRDALRAQGPGLVMGLAFGAIVIGIWNEHHMIRGEESDRGDVTFLVPATIAHHLATALWPSSTSPLYPLAREQPLSVPFALFACAALIAAMVLGWRARANALGARVLFGVVAFLVLLAPVTNIVPIYFQWQDRYLCFPLLGLAFIVGALIESARGARWAYAAVALGLAALGARTVQYEASWRSDDALWENAVHAQPRAFYAWLKLGEVRRDSGRYAGALRAYQEAIEIAPQLRLGHAAFLSALMMRDESRFSIEPSRVAAETQRYMARMDDAVALRELAGDLAELGYRDAVTFVLARSLDLEPIPDERLENAAVVQLEQGNEWLARFYMGRLTREPVVPLIRGYVARERLRHAELRPDPSMRDDAAQPAPESDPESVTEPGGPTPP